MNTTLKILHLEDLASDADLVNRQLQKGNIRYENVLVETREQFEHQLAAFKPDIILSDHSLPSFNSMEALKLMKAAGVDIPFILLTSTVSEDFAVSIMKEGASDYILKDRLQRLPQAIENAMEKHRFAQERKASDEKLKQSEALYREFFEAAAEAILIFDPAKNKVTDSNQNAQRLLGLSATELNTRCLEEISASVQDDGIDIQVRSGELVNETIANSKATSEWIFRDVSGKQIFCEARLTLIGQVEKLIRISIIDISERRSAEIERSKMTQDILKRNAALEQFTYFVSHNLRAPLSNILGICQLFKDADMQVDEMVPLLDGIQKSAKNLDNIIKDLSNIIGFNNVLNERVERVDFAEIVESVKISLATALNQQDIHIQTDFDEAGFMLSVKTYLYSIFYNLISNSIKYRMAGVPAIINIKSAVDQDKLNLVFCDNGKGIDLVKYGRELFGLYKRFDNSIAGKGLGLFMVKTQVESLGGRIALESKVHEGCEFRLSFPV